MAITESPNPPVPPVPPAPPPPPLPPMTVPSLPAPRAPAPTWGEKLSGKGALAVTGAIFALLFMGMAVTAWRSDQQGFANLLETVKALSLLAAGFWLGSSRGSQKKDETIAAANAALATSAPVTTP